MAADDMNEGSDEQENIPKSGRPKKSNTRPESKSKRGKKKPLSIDEILRSFITCGRCSFLLAGYQTIHGQNILKNAEQSRSGRWLQLQWDQDTQRLLQQTYGCRLDVGWYHIEGCCPECLRRFVYSEVKSGKPVSTFRVELIHK